MIERSPRETTLNLKEEAKEAFSQRLVRQLRKGFEQQGIETLLNTRGCLTRTGKESSAGFFEDLTEECGRRGFERREMLKLIWSGFKNEEMGLEEQQAGLRIYQSLLGKDQWEKKTREYSWRRLRLLPEEQETVPAVGTPGLDAITLTKKLSWLRTEQRGTKAVKRKLKTQASKISEQVGESFEQLLTRAEKTAVSLEKAGLKVLETIFPPPATFLSEEIRKQRQKRWQAGTKVKIYEGPRFGRRGFLAGLGIASGFTIAAASPTSREEIKRVFTGSKEVMENFYQALTVFKEMLARASSPEHRHQVFLSTLRKHEKLAGQLVFSRSCSLTLPNGEVLNGTALALEEEQFPLRVEIPESGGEQAVVVTNLFFNGQVGYRGQGEYQDKIFDGFGRRLATLNKQGQVVSLYLRPGDETAIVEGDKAARLVKPWSPEMILTPKGMFDTTKAVKSFSQVWKQYHPEEIKPLLLESLTKEGKGSSWVYEFVGELGSYQYRVQEAGRIFRSQGEKPPVFLLRIKRGGKTWFLEIDGWRNSRLFPRPELQEWPAAVIPEDTRLAEAIAQPSKHQGLYLQKDGTYRQERLYQWQESFYDKNGRLLAKGRDRPGTFFLGVKDGERLLAVLPEGASFKEVDSLPVYPEKRLKWQPVTAPATAGKDVPERAQIQRGPLLLAAAYDGQPDFKSKRPWGELRRQENGSWRLILWERG